MNKSITLSWMDKLAALGLVGAATGIVIQILSNVVTATIPVGVIVLLALALLIVLRVWKWTTTVGGVIASLLLIIAVFIAPGLMNRLSNPSNFGPFSGTALQLLGLIITIFGSATATVRRIGLGTGSVGSRHTGQF